MLTVVVDRPFDDEYNLNNSRASIADNLPLGNQRCLLIPEIDLVVHCIPAVDNNDFATMHRNLCVVSDELPWIELRIFGCRERRDERSLQSLQIQSLRSNT